MPNWTFNRITVKGERKDLDKFMADGVRGKDGGLYLSSWIPTPETFRKYDTTNHPDGKGLFIGSLWWDGLGGHDGQVVTEELIEEFKRATEEQREKYGVVGWYDYNVKTFGCKWDSEVNVELITDDSISLYAETPWSAPENWLRTLSEKYPELVFQLHAEYEEGFWEDMEFGEGLKAEKGKGEVVWDEEEEEEEEI